MRARPDEMARARLWQVLTTDLCDLLGPRALDEGNALSPPPPQRVECTHCHGTGVVLEV